MGMADQTPPTKEVIIIEGDEVIAPAPEPFDWGTTVVWPCVIVVVALVIGMIVKRWLGKKDKPNA